MLDDDDDDFLTGSPGDWKEQILALFVIGSIAAICYGVLKLIEWVRP